MVIFRTRGQQPEGTPTPKRTRKAKQDAAEALAVEAATPHASLRILAILLDNIERAREREGYVDGSVIYRLTRILKASDEYGLSREEAAELRLFLKLYDAATERDGFVERRRAQNRVNAVNGGNGLNF